MCSWCSLSHQLRALDQGSSEGPWLVAVCSMRQSWLSVLLVLLLLPIRRRKITQAQPSKDQHTPSPSPFPHGFGGHPSLWLRRKIKCLISPPESVSHFQGLSAWGRNPVVWVAVLEGRQEILSFTQKYISSNQPSWLIPCQLLTGGVLCSPGLTGV